MAVIFIGTAIRSDAKEQAVDEVQNLMDGILTFETDSEEADVQSWLNRKLSEDAGQNAEWYVLAIRQMGKQYNYTKYLKALKHYLSENSLKNAVSRQKYALVLYSLGTEEEFVEQTVEETIGAQGIMSYIYGLHLLNNGVKESNLSTEEVIEYIFEQQLEDGGWAIGATQSDIDVTAMALAALAPNYLKDTKYHEKIEKALLFLSENQLSEGDYASYGIPNPESTAQVVLALTSLGIDCLQDERFVKGEYTLLDGLMKYHLDNGAFSHTQGGEASASANRQVLCALTAIQQFENNTGSFYLYNQKDSNFIITKTKSTVIWSVQLILSGILLMAALLIRLVLFLLHKRNKKNYLAVLFLTAILIVLVNCIHIQSKSDYYKAGEESKDIIGEVVLSISCEAVAGRTDGDYIADDGWILIPTEIGIETDTSVFELLLEASKKYQFQIDYSGNYVSGIQYLYEMDFGNLSGWIYYVNGEQAAVGSKQFILQDGDNVEWRYTCNMGRD